MIRENKHIFRFELLMDAGFGAQKAGDILISAFARMGKYVYIEPMIPAEISPPPRTRPALSGVIIRIADFDVTNIGNDTDLILAAHEVVLNRRLDDEETNPNCRVLLDLEDKNKNPEEFEEVCKRLTKLGYSIYPFSLQPEADALIKSLGGKGKNIFYLGILSHVYNMPEEVMMEEIKRTFGKKLTEDILNKNIQLFHFGFQLAGEKIPFSFEVVSTAPKTEEKILIDGNSAISMGIIDAGIKLICGYPITPASSILHTLAKTFPSYGGMVHQAEDEISAIGTTIGAYYGGVPAITCTSGPGLSLKQEFIGYASVAEIPVIVVDVQRSGPSTGMPTKTEQSDLLAVIFGSHGDYTKIVISVANVIDCFYAPQIARFLAEKLRLPIFILSDFQTANSYKVILKPKINEIENIDDIPDFVFERFHLNRLSPNIEMVRTSQSIPGTVGGMRRVTGLNTDASGSINYFSKANQRSHEIRNEKVHHVRRALTVPEMFGKPEGEVLVVGWGSSRGAIEETINNCVAEGIPASGMNFRIVHPFPLMLKEIFSKFKKIVTVELAYGDQYKSSPLAMLLKAETCREIQPLVARATGRPLRPRDLKEKIQRLIK